MPLVAPGGACHTFAHRLQGANVDMANLLTLTISYPLVKLARGECLVEEGEADGALFVLSSGQLSVERDGVQIAEIGEPGALVGEMSVLLGIDHSATVRTLSPVEARRIDDGLAFLERSPLAALHVATVACQRLNATSGLLAELRRDAQGSRESGFFERLFGTVSGQSRPPQRIITHE